MTAKSRPTITYTHTHTQKMLLKITKSMVYTMPKVRRFFFCEYFFFVIWHRRRRRKKKCFVSLYNKLQTSITSSRQYIWTMIIHLYFTKINFFFFRVSCHFFVKDGAHLKLTRSLKRHKTKIDGCRRVTPVYSHLFYKEKMKEVLR